MKLAISLIECCLLPFIDHNDHNGGMKGYRRKSFCSHDQFVSSIVVGPNMLIHPISHKGCIGFIRCIRCTYN
jgi:hypothetical protein